MSTSAKGHDMESNEKSNHSGPQATNCAERNKFKVGNAKQFNNEPYYNKMSKRPTSKQGRNSSSVSKENWNSLYSDVDCVNRSPSNQTFYDGISPESVNHDLSADNCSNKFGLDSTNHHHIGVDRGCVKVPWHEYESSNSNVVDITHWIMNTLGSAIKLRFLDLAGLETYISQIILLIKLITTTSGVKQNNRDASLTSSLVAIPSATSLEPSRNGVDRQTTVYDRTGIRLKEKRFSDIVGVIKGKKHLKNYSSNG